MKLNLGRALTTLSRKGLLETAINLNAMLLTKLTSILRVLILNLRGYNIDKSVMLKGRTFFFQSFKRSIQISQKTTIGDNTRITTGEDGKILIGKNVHIDDFVFIMAHKRIEIGDNTTIAPFVFIMDFNHKFGNRNSSVMNQGYTSESVIIGKNVWIGTHSSILPGVKIGDGSIIGAGSVVTRNVPSNSVSAGNPASVIKRIYKTK